RVKWRCRLLRSQQKRGPDCSTPEQPAFYLRTVFVSCDVSLLTTGAGFLKRRNPASVVWSLPCPTTTGRALCTLPRINSRKWVLRRRLRRLLRDQIQVPPDDRQPFQRPIQVLGRVRRHVAGAQ